MTAELPQEKPDSQEGAELSREEVVLEIARLAALDRRRGIRYWFDGELTDSLRDLTLGGRASAKTAAPRAQKSATSLSRPTASPPTGPRPAGPRPAGPPAASRPASRPATPERASGSASPSPTRPPAAKSAKIPDWGPPPLAIGRDPDWAERLAILGRRAGECRQCQLCETRNKVVFGVGSAVVPLVFVGEAPGADEDRQGYPFVGRAGQLLDKIIRAIGLERDEIYICNVLKCRPPGNRNPAPDEIAKCTPFLQEQLTILKPRVICTLGLFASQFLLGSQLSMGKLRGRILDYHGTPLVPTYHPAALLRNPSYKAAVWDDVQLVRRTLDS